MKALSSISLFIAGIVILLVSSSLFIVDEREKAILLRFGEIVKADYTSGLHFKIPFVNNVQLFDARVQTLDSPPESYLTKEKKNVKVDSFFKWRIQDVRTFFISTGGNMSRASNRLSQIIKDGLRAEFGKRQVQEVVSGERKDVMNIIGGFANTEAKRFGIEILAVRIKRVDLPSNVSNSVYRRMEAERQRVATELRSQGQEQSEKIKAEADRKRVVTLAEAFEKAEKTRGEGDAIATNLYAKSYTKDGEFYRFYRSLSAYTNSFKDKGDILLLDTKSQFFEHFGGSSAKK
jgi:membrane protease subunit HflC